MRDTAFLSPLLHSLPCLGFASNLEVHTLLAEFFLGTWAGEVAKPFTLSPEVAKQFGVHATGVAVRHVAAQPLVYPATSTGGVLVNGLRCVVWVDLKLLALFV